MHVRLYRSVARCVEVLPKGSEVCRNEGKYYREIARCAEVCMSAAERERDVPKRTERREIKGKERSNSVDNNSTIGSLTRVGIL